MEVICSNRYDAETCSKIKMLVSRKKQAAEGKRVLQKYKNKCTCILVPLFLVQKWGKNYAKCKLHEVDIKMSHRRKFHIDKHMKMKKAC